MLKKDPPVFLLPEPFRILADRLEHSLCQHLDELRGDIRKIEVRLAKPVVLPLPPEGAGSSEFGASSAATDFVHEDRQPPAVSAEARVSFNASQSDGSCESSLHACMDSLPPVTEAGEPLPTIQDGGEVDEMFVVQSGWEQVIVTQKPFTFAQSIQKTTNSSWDELIHCQPTRHSLGEISKLIIRPSSRKRLAWDVASMVVIGYDMVTIPFTLAFLNGVNEALFLQVMFWVCLIWWTTDIPLSFVSGYYQRGMEEMRPRYIVLNYLRTWCLFDCMIVGADWSAVFLGSQQRGASMVRMGKTLRFLRVIRSLRLLRLTKVRRILEAIQDRITSEWFHIVLGVLKLSFLLMLFNHLLACIWWALSRATAEGTDAWSADERYAGSSLGYQYCTSLHWTITQFTPAGMEVSPHNFHERIFAVFVCLVAMIFFSNFVSSITAAMTQLRQLSSQTNREFAVLRRFLRDRKIHGNLRLRIIRYAEHRVSMRKSETQEQDVTLLKLLSKPLRVELVVQSRAPVLTQHPFFMHYQEADPDAMSQVCCNAVMHVLLSRGDVLFTVGVQCEHMVFVFRGALIYLPEPAVDHEDGQSNQQSHTKGLSSHSHSSFPTTGLGRQLTEKSDSGPIQVGEKEWCCEQALWTSWTHLGTMRATAMSEVLLVSASSFRDVTLAHSRVAYRAARYGKAFVDVVNGNGGKAKTSDIADFSPQSLAEDVFENQHSAERTSEVSVDLVAV